jgi:hypothetical protein
LHCLVLVTPHGDLKPVHRIAPFCVLAFTFEESFLEAERRDMGNTKYWYSLLHSLDPLTLGDVSGLLRYILQDTVP